MYIGGIGMLVLIIITIIGITHIFKGSKPLLRPKTRLKDLVELDDKYLNIHISNEDMHNNGINTVTKISDYCNKQDPHLPAEKIPNVENVLPMCEYKPGKKMWVPHRYEFKFSQIQMLGSKNTFFYSKDGDQEKNVVPGSDYLERGDFLLQNVIEQGIRLHYITVVKDDNKLKIIMTDDDNNHTNSNIEPITNGIEFDMINALQSLLLLTFKKKYKDPIIIYLNFIDDRIDSNLIISSLRKLLSSIEDYNFNVYNIGITTMEELLNTTVKKLMRHIIFLTNKEVASSNLPIIHAKSVNLVDKYTTKELEYLEKKETDKFYISIEDDESENIEVENKKIYVDDCSGLYFCDVHNITNPLQRLHGDNKLRSLKVPREEKKMEYAYQLPVSDGVSMTLKNEHGVETPIDNSEKDVVYDTNKKTNVYLIS
jgi:hypothetical protein